MNTISKIFSIAILFATLAFTSCNTREKVIYLQDLGTIAPVQPLEEIKFEPGDKLSIIVTSCITPEASANFNLPVITTSAVSGVTYSSNQVAYYTVGTDGNIQMPGLGTVQVQGKTRTQLTNEIQNDLRQGLLNDAVVTISTANQYITVLGEIARPGRYNITRDNITLLEVLGMAGDLTIQANRSRILVMRQEGNEMKNYYVDLRSKDVLASPVFNLKQNDIVYVEPNTVRSNQYVNNANSIRQVSTWLSLLSFITTTIILIKEW
ncbi:MAG: polysaccharide biosynthesis/export family protein [Bacteroidaceae bacterium]|nr:polysaccharide biosynthesis/export family protein [Bacteroidaceae bacterium]